MSERSAAYCERFHPEATLADWSDWTWQLRNRVRRLDDVLRVLVLSEEERKTIERIGGRLPLGVTPYYMSLIDPLDPADPIRRSMIPVSGELVRGLGEADDPLSEDDDSPVPGLVHRYPDRVLFLVTNFCATYCRYCTRARMVGHTGEYHFNNAQYQQALDYIAAHREVRDVLLSGGDPLTMRDERLDWLLTRLRAIPHVEFVRVGTKVPAVLPQRITPALVAMLRRHKVWMSIHFMHPAELTPEVEEACERIADAGIPTGSQSVLIRGVNDDVDTLKQLTHGLLKIRVRPYYLYQCDPISGSEHLRTPVEQGLRIIAGLQGHTTGYAVPTFVVDGPGGAGKIPLFPETVVGRDGDFLLLRNYAGEISAYPDPLPRTSVDKRAASRKRRAQRARSALPPSQSASGASAPRAASGASREPSELHSKPGSSGRAASGASVGRRPERAANPVSRTASPVPPGAPRAERAKKRVGES
jgi:lysine 2,3-aminomutase